MSTREEEMRAGQWMLGRAIPFHEWLGRKPRTAAAIDQFHFVMACVRALAESGDIKVGRPPETYGPGPWVTDDETEFFDFDDRTVP